MVKAPIYTIKGTKTGELTLPREMFEVKPNLNLLAQAVHIFRERSHTGLRKTQTRAEVNRTTKKIYKQKGTGGARHGSRRANLYVGGGVALGPRPERRILTMSQAMRNKAKAYAFSAKAGEKEIVAVSGVATLGKTKEAAGFLAKLTKEIKAKRFTFVLSDSAKESFKFLRNLGNASAFFYKEVNAFDIWNGGIIVLDKEIFEKVAKPVQKTAKKTVKKAK